MREGRGKGRGGEGPRSAPQVNFLDPPMHRRADCKLQRFGHVNAKKMQFILIEKLDNISVKLVA